MSEQFNIYSFQLIFSFINNQQKPINLLKLKSGDIIQLQQYLSCTYDKSTFDIYLIKITSCLLIIRVGKKNKSWILLDNYSYFQNEKEILIKKESLLVFNELTYKNIHGIERPVLTFTLFDDDEQMLEYSNSISGTTNLYENPLLSQSYITILEYINNKYFKQKYRHADKIKCDDMPENYVFLYNSDVLYSNGIETTYRPVHGLVHAVRVSIWVYIYCLNILKYDYNETWKDMINPKFILKVCIASLFLVSGRESEQGNYIIPDFEKKCNFLDGLDKVKKCGIDMVDGYSIFDYKHAHELYRKASAQNFKNAILAHQFIKNIFDEGEIDEFVSIFPRYYSSTLLTTDREKLIGFLFKNAHNLDLVRINSHLKNYLIPIHRNKNIEEFNEINKKFINLSINMCKLTGDNVLVKTYKEDTENNINNIINSLQYMNRTFIDFNNNPKYCVSNLLDFINPYIKTLIIDIEENKYKFTPKIPQYQIIQNNKDYSGLISNFDKLMKEYIKDTVIETLSHEYITQTMQSGGVNKELFLDEQYNDISELEQYNDISELEQYYENRTFGNIAYLSKNSSLKLNNINIEECIILFHKSIKYTDMDEINTDILTQLITLKKELPVIKNNLFEEQNSPEKHTINLIDEQPESIPINIHPESIPIKKQKNKSTNDQLAPPYSPEINTAFAQYKYLKYKNKYLKYKNK